VRAQILIAQGAELHGRKWAAAQDDIPRNGFAIQCRVTTEDPENKFMPNYGKIITYPQRRRLRHPARCGHGRRGRGSHAVLRFAAREDHGDGADLRDVASTAWTARSRIPHPRR
jgi:hypothetical protein